MGLLLDFILAPFEKSRLCIVSADEMIDRFAQLFDIDKAGSLECVAAQNAKPALNLVKPRSVGWGKMKISQLPGNLMRRLTLSTAQNYLGSLHLALLCLSGFKPSTQLLCLFWASSSSLPRCAPLMILYVVQNVDAVFPD